MINIETGSAGRESTKRFISAMYKSPVSLYLSLYLAWPSYCCGGRRLLHLRNPLLLHIHMMKDLPLVLRLGHLPSADYDQPWLTHPECVKRREKTRLVKRGEGKHSFEEKILIKIMCNVATTTTSFQSCQTPTSQSHAPGQKGSNVVCQARREARTALVVWLGTSMVNDE